MPVILRGRSKSRLELQWDGSLPVNIRIVSQLQRTIPLYQCQIDVNRFQLELDQLDFSKLEGNPNELNLIATAKWQKGQPEYLSDPIAIHRCQHSNCGQWGHAREDGYCRHCGRRIKEGGYCYGFPKLEISNFSIVLWNGIEGKLWKKKESRETSNSVYSMGKYEDKGHYRDYVEILEEKYNSQQAQRFVEFYQILKDTDLLDKFWKPPFPVFQEEHQRSIWIYYPWLPKQKKWRQISVLSYITSSDVNLLNTKDIVQIGIQLCEIVEKIHNHGYLWASLKLSDLILTQNKINEISLYLTTREIAWNSSPSKTLLDTCLIPWELYWDEELRGGYEVTEVYIIAALLYFLKAKSPNLLSYNSLAYPYGLPSLKIFDGPDRQPQQSMLDYFEAVLNQALILTPEERSFKSIGEFKLALSQLLQAKPSQLESCRLDVGKSLNIGDEKRENEQTKNQDAVFTTDFTLEKEGWGLFILCDGVSTATIGTGDQASTIIVQTFEEWWANHSHEERLMVCQYASTDFARACQCLKDIVNIANRRICEAAGHLATPEKLEDAIVMGSTMTVGLIYHRDIVYGWVGDSPIYRINPFFGWERLNYDHNERNYRLKEGMPLEECFIEGGNALTHCVGAHFYLENNIGIKFDRTYLYPGEHILICSDGIPDYIELESTYAHNENYQMLRISSIVYEYEKDNLLDAKAMASILVSSANRIGGGLDNLSAILIRVLPENSVSSEKAYKRLKVLGKEMQTLMRQTNLAADIISPDNRCLPVKKENLTSQEKSSSAEPT